MLQLIKYHIDKEIIAEWGEEVYKSLEFKWEDYDIEEDIKKHSLYKMQLDMGLKTPEMIAEAEGINYEEVKKYKEEQEDKEIDKMKFQSALATPYQDDKGLKAEKYESRLEKELVLGLKQRAKEINQAFDLYEKGQLGKIR